MGWMGAHTILDPASSRVAALAMVCSLLVLGSADGARAGGGSDLPNLVPKSPHGIRFAALDPALGAGKWAVRFTTASMNAGPVPLDILGLPQDLETSTAMQCVRFAGPACLERAPVGDLVWHPSHQHFHMERFALYELRTLMPDGTPDFRPEGLLGEGRKVSFCLIDSHQDVDQIGPSNIPRYLVCSNVQQGISPGWSDVYDHTVDGQHIPIDGVPPGRYALVITLDPDALLHEQTRTDNTAFSWVWIPELD